MEAATCNIISILQQSAVPLHHGTSVHPKSAKGISQATWLGFFGTSLSVCFHRVAAACRCGSVACCCHGAGDSALRVSRARDDFSSSQPQQALADLYELDRVEAILDGEENPNSHVHVPAYFRSTNKKQQSFLGTNIW
jgi:hypothetical protein